MKYPSDPWSEPECRRSTDRPPQLDDESSRRQTLVIIGSSVLVVVGWAAFWFWLGYMAGVGA